MDKAPESVNGSRYPGFIDDLALALDGEVSEDAYETEAAYEAALLADQLVLRPSINRLRAFDQDRIAVAAHRYDDLPRLLQTVDVPFRLLADGESIGDAVLVLLGCGVNERVGNEVIDEAREAGTIIVTSDRAACIEALSRVLRPLSPSSPRTARARWNRVGVDGLVVPDGDTAPTCHAVALSPGHVPVSPTGSRSRVLLTDAFTGEALVTLQRDRGLQLLHAVPHWWQSSAIVDTAVDRRRVRDIPAYEGLGMRFPELMFGQFSAARVMLSSFLVGVTMALNRRPDAGAF